MKYSITFSAQIPGLREKPRFDHIKNEELCKIMIFLAKFSKSNIYNQRSFTV